MTTWQYNLKVNNVKNLRVFDKRRAPLFFYRGVEKTNSAILSCKGAFL